MADEDISETTQGPFDFEMTEAGTLPYIPGTTETKPWSCTLFDPAYGVFTEEDLKDLCGTNCSVIDNESPVTIWKILLHARKLIKLARHLLGSDGFQVVNGKARRRPGNYVDELWEILANPRTPLQIKDEIYQVPLWGLANQVNAVDETKGIEFHCPLTVCRDFGPLAPEEGVRRPYRNHHNLVMHINECMEILDHEYAATGGLLSLLPTESEDDDEQLEAARNTIFGQWLLFTQHLVARMHELELNYANALDMLSGEAVVPMQMLSRLGPDGRSKGREIIYPQDKFIIVNVGEDIVTKLHHLMDKAEAEYNEDEQQFWESGTSGERMWKKDRAGQWYSRGLVSVDLQTRFYRLKDQGRDSTIFILPAIDYHPGVARTREVEKQPTVVSVVNPRWTDRVSDLEERLREPLKSAKQMEDASRALQRQNLELQDKLTVVSAELKKTQIQVRYYEATAEEGSREEVEAALRAHQDKLERLRTILPSKYHADLEF
ncbi:hypothetical protein PT974_09656 [Cladobotryum mycophilum]|uniref:Uncharacterized protein n=1 Tax=Cladobotryum mycophilum TaxID=491253 RepID=A0ABR0SGW3_9HYPO